MKKNSAALGFAVVALAGCSGTNGFYAPACPMFEGQTITLDSGRFVVDKFTDSVELDDADNPIDPFPGYPMHGDYRIEGNVVHMRSDSGTDLPTLYLAEVGNKKWLLTDSEYEEWTRDGSVGACSLARGHKGAK
jgi:hypothetical protein